MILVDSSVLIDLLGNVRNQHTARLEELLARRAVVGVADLVMAEVLQGTRSERDFRHALRVLTVFPSVSIVDTPVVIQAARNYRDLRNLGITVRKTIDTLIATRCIVDDIPLLFADRDFRPFVEHLKLRSALDDTGVN